MNEELLFALQQHKKWAQEKLYSLYRLRFINYILSKTNRLQFVEAEEITHNAFLQIFKTAGSYSYIGTFDSYMFCILRNQMLQWIDRNIYAPSKKLYRYIANFEEDALQISPEHDNNLDAELLNSEVKKILITKMQGNTCKKHGYEIVKMYSQGYNCRDIAERLDISLTSTKSAKQKAILNIKHLLK